MDKASKEHPLTIEKIRRNLRITRKRSPVERSYSVIKGIINGYIPSHCDHIEKQVKIV
jgi:IS5 family transposase